MPSVPPQLQRLFDEWDGEGRPAQRSFPWKGGGWKRWLPEHSNAIESLQNPLGRSGVTKLCSGVSDEHAAMHGFLAASIWGFGDAGYGPYRTRAILDNNPSFARDLLQFAKVAQTLGGLAAFEHAVNGRRATRNYFRGYGPAFATKFIYFTTKAAPDVETSPVMDKIVATWFRKHVPGSALRLDWHSAESYKHYLTCVKQWANELEITSDEVEQLIFTPGRT
ncbi:hypothetical protein QFZ30_003121 [Arthrobacter pascens]|uniref:8-oxoguanine DNA glycosylase OGG fold protein n=1 Tax=Arthrobacter pascens TaxID=1677 RepID=UPI00278CA424|nr:hypothetical protein [Arthrobacter pascens]MDQ0679739.1 hypothetical protein [Arthrobacter pascens]